MKLYRHGSLGSALQIALRTLRERGDVTEEQSARVLAQFDSSFNRALDTVASAGNASSHLFGDLRNVNRLGEQWRFDLGAAMVRLDGEVLELDRLTLVGRHDPAMRARKACNKRAPKPRTRSTV